MNSTMRRSYKLEKQKAAALLTAAKERANEIEAAATKKAQEIEAAANAREKELQAARDKAVQDNLDDKRKQIDHLVLYYVLEQVHSRRPCLS